MIISKNQSRALAVAVLVLFLALSIVMIKFSRAGIPGKFALDLPRISIEERTNNVVLGKFHRAEMKNGKKAWEITAEKGRFITDKNEIVVSMAVLSVFRDDGSSAELKADEATLALTGTDIQSAHAVGNVVISRNQEITITTPDAFYDKVNGVITAKGPVTIRSETFDADGDELTVNLTTEEATLTKNVRSVVRKKEKKETR